ncbi:juvenile hormone esterase [Anabrus simplex]|uniref:juvenile hormone esterase n=1 Tax=Anabrus simplex TaxID=316456 RepID=UPI0035A292B5
MKTIDGKNIFAFRGIPFAKPPVGDLRFRAPVAVDPWDGIRDATKDGAPCAQLDQRFGPPSEDCLNLNVYTRKLPKTKRGRLRPVMVFFYPGGFFSLTGNSLFAGPQYIMDQDIVFVSGNYRLAALGFLSMQDANLPGNYGMKDQVLLLRWVQDNIAAFGGDPTKVTIFGYSAGSWSVLLHMMSPMSQGLFHRCIASSATPFTPKNGRPPAEIARQLAGLLNCPTGSSKEIAECLRQKKAEDIVGTLGEFREFAWDPISVFKPEVEPDLGDGEERFLTDDPVKLVLDGKFAHVPLITGHTTLEFAWKSLEILTNTSWTQELNDDFERVGPIIFGYERGTQKSRQVSRELRKFYFNNQPISNATEEELGKLYADSIINFGQYRAAKLISRKSRAPVYFYKFSYPGKWSYIYWPPGTNDTYGVVHHDDLIYLIYNSVYFPMMTSQDKEYQMMKTMTKMWTDFMKEGNPTPRRSPVKWKPYTARNLNYLDIGTTLSMKRGLYQERMSEWEKLFPLPGINPIKRG